MTHILWISDIHFREHGDISHSEALSKPKSGKKFIDNFINKIQELNTQTPFDYVIISGDLAFSGVADEYEKLHKSIIKRIQTTLINIPVFSIPGNHDVAWNNSTLDWYKENEEEFIKKHENKEAYLKEKPDVFKIKFNSYSKYTSKQLNTDTLEKCTGIAIEGEDSYKELGLFGYFKDDDKETILIFINSAWFSLGSKIDDRIKKIAGANIDLVLKLKEMAAEYGGLIVGKQWLEDLNVLAEIRRNPHYKIITVMHQPPSWLAWQELRNYDRGVDNAFLDIVNASHLLLTGHEHVPVDTLPRRLNYLENRWHIEAPMFLPDKLNTQKTTAPFGLDDFKDTGFTTLKIDNKETQLNRYYFTPLGEWLPNANNPLKLPLQTTPLEIEINDLKDKINGFNSSNNTKIIKFLNENYGIEIGDFIEYAEYSYPDYLENSFLCKYYVFEKEKIKRIVVIPTFDNFYKILEEESDIFDRLIRDRMTDLSKKNYVHLLCFEALTGVEKNSEAYYKFEEYRNSVFSRYDIESEVEITLIPLFKNIKNIRFINMIIADSDSIFLT